jgi:hypothetical protein
MMMMMQHAASGAKPFPALQASQNAASEARCGLFPKLSHSKMEVTDFETWADPMIK